MTTPILHCTTKSLGLAILSILAGALLHSEVQAQIVVSGGGSATLTRTLTVPPGVGGLAPQLVLSYDSRDRSSSTLGVGWSLNGIPVIERCSATRSPDGVVRGPNYGIFDKLCLDGERLIPIDASGNGLVGAQTQDATGRASSEYTEFRTEKDSYARIRAYGFGDGFTPVSGPAWFRVWTKSGQILDFGDSPTRDSNTNAFIPANYTGGAQTVAKAQAWAVSRIADVNGNAIHFKYSQTINSWGSQSQYSSSLEWKIAEIQYSGNKIVFGYDVRAVDSPHDRTETHREGVKSTSLARLRTVTTYINSPNTAQLGPAAGAVAVATYRLGYDRAGVSKRSRLASVQQCAGDSASTRCLPASKFTYSTGSNERYREETAFNLTDFGPYYGNVNHKWRFFVADFNGDGRDDILSGMTLAFGQGQIQQLWFSNGDGTFTKSANFDSAQYPVTALYDAQLVDVNNDGLPDFFVHMDANVGPSQIYFNKGNGIFQPTTVSGISFPPLTSVGPEESGWGAYWVDVDGDGKVDVVLAYYPGGGGPYGSLYGSAVCQAHQIVCTRIFKGDGLGGFSEIPTNLKHLSVYSSASNIEGVPTTMDVDGDGLQDIVITNGVTVPLVAGAGTTTYRAKTRIARSLGDGNFEVLEGPECPEATHRFCGALALDYAGGGRFSLAMGTELGPTHNRLFVADGIGNTFSSVGNTDLTATGRDLVTAYIYEDLDPGARAPCPNGAPLAQCPGFNLLAQATAPYRFRATPSTSTYVQVTGGSLILDANSDGRDDVLLWSSVLGGNKLLISNGDGTFASSGSFNLNGDPMAHCLGGKGPDPRLPDRVCQLFVGNFTGRGHAEILQTVSTFSGVPPGILELATTRLFVKENSEMPDLLVSMTTETGSTASINYFKAAENPLLQYGRRYVGDAGTSNAAVTPLVDVPPKEDLVASLSLDSGVGQARREVHFRYTGMKFDTGGRGSVGFRQVEQQSPGADGLPLLSRNTYLQQFPYVGSLATARQYAASLADPVADDSGYLSFTQNVYCDQTADLGAYNAALSSSLATPCFSTAIVKRPYLAKSVVKRTDLDGSTLPQTTTTALPFTAFGDPTNITVVNTVTGAPSNTFQSVTTFLYDPENTACTDIANCKWVVGRLSASTETRGVPTQTLSTSAGTAPGATLLSGLEGATLTLMGSGEFGWIGKSAQPTTRTLQFRNTGFEPVTIEPLTAAAVVGARFSLAPNSTCGGALPPGATCNVLVQLDLSVIGQYSGALTLQSTIGAKVVPLGMRVHGSGAPRVVPEPPNYLYIGPTPVGQIGTNGVVTLTNVGTDTMKIESVEAITSSGAPVFSIQQHDCPPVLAVNQSCTITPAFAPVVDGGNQFGEIRVRYKTNENPGNPSIVEASAMLNGTTTISAFDRAVVDWGTDSCCNQTSPGWVTVRLQNFSPTETLYVTWAQMTGDPNNMFQGGVDYNANTSMCYWNYETFEMVMPPLGWCEVTVGPPYPKNIGTHQGTFTVTLKNKTTAPSILLKVKYQ